MAVGGLHAFDHGLDLRIGGIAHRRRQVRQRAREIVGDGQHVAGEVRHGIVAGVGPLAFGAAARILRLGQRAQQLVLQLDILGIQRRDDIGGMRLARVESVAVRLLRSSSSS